VYGLAFYLKYKNIKTSFIRDSLTLIMSYPLEKAVTASVWGVSSFFENDVKDILSTEEKERQKRLAIKLGRIFTPDFVNEM
jgi:hypothetical protein